ncbi:MAG: Glu/Leu/Phe/Val dehydrogenase dimerization domain-containing protein [Hyphomicrobiaceae bacterium]
MLFNHEEFADHEQIVFARNPARDLSAIIAVHSTALGPALGGLRVWPYPNEAAALTDVLRLAKGMTYKAAIAGIPFGGGKAVILARPGNKTTPELMEAIGVEIQRLGGRYITGEDVGTTATDMAAIRKTTSHVMGMPVELGGSGDPSVNTALGCFVGIQAAVEHALGKTTMRDVHVAVQGVGNVGYNLCLQLAEAGASLTLSDTNAERLERAAQLFKARSVAPHAIYDVEADVLAPCAVGGIINNAVVPRLKVRVVAGGANNQLQAGEHGRALQARGVLYAPDFVINAGGMIQLSAELTGETSAQTESRVRAIGPTLQRLFVRSTADEKPTNDLACELAEERIRTRRTQNATRS